MLKIILPLVAIIVLGALSAFALAQGVNGALFASIAAIIGGLAGYSVKGLINTRKPKG